MRYFEFHEAYQYEMFPPHSLYHTTSPGSVFDILKAGELRPRNGESFVSFSERPHLHDIREHGAAIIFDLRQLYGQLEPVQYTEAWAQAHPDEVRYIAGEGWEQQFEYHPEDDGDEFDDDDRYEEEHAAAELEAFLQKADEDEWISLHSGMPVRFTPACVRGIMLHQIDADTRTELAAMGYGHVELRQS